MVTPFTSIHTTNFISHKSIYQTNTFSDLFLFSSTLLKNTKDQSAHSNSSAQEFKTRLVHRALSISDILDFTATSNTFDTSECHRRREGWEEKGKKRKKNEDSVAVVRRVCRALFRTNCWKQRDQFK